MAASFFLSFRGVRATHEPGISINNLWIPDQALRACPE
jgi:hypothetical protein